MREAEQSYAIHSIDHFTLVVPDMGQAAHFFDAFGLQLEAQADRLLLRAAASEHVWGCIIAGAQKQLAYLTFNCYAEDYAPLVTRLQSLANSALPHPQARYADGYWFQDADGNLIQLRVGPKTTIDFKPAASLIEPEGVRGVSVGRQTISKVIPDRMSHVLLFASDVPRQVAFYRDALGLRLSDCSEDVIAFLHAPHGSDHHLMAFAKSHRRGWHHSSWDVPGVEDVGRGWMQMQKAGYINAWGTGRHVLGSNYFCYMEDPWGSFCEYSADMDYVPAGTVWPAGEHPPEDSLYLWGPPPPANFIVNHETA